MCIDSCKVWTTQPNQFRLSPMHHTVGLNTTLDDSNGG
jgi:hypothetical protein